jgi:hypothetical protein
MKPEDLARNLNERGFQLDADGDNLFVSPGSALTNDDRNLIRKFKFDLLDLLRSTEVRTQTERQKADCPFHRAVEIARRCERTDSELKSHLEANAPELLTERSRPDVTPAKALIRTCYEYGIALRVDPDGTLIVVSNGRVWRSLLDAIEEHTDEIARLLI